MVFTTLRIFNTNELHTEVAHLITYVHFTTININR